MSAPNLHAKPYTDLARASAWYLHHKEDERATAAFLEALRVVRASETWPRRVSLLSGLRVHLMSSEELAGRITFLQSSPSSGYSDHYLNSVEQSVLDQPNALVWACSKVDMLLPDTNVPPSVRAFAALFEETEIIDERRIDAFYTAVGHLLRDQPQVQEAALFLLAHVGERARLCCW